MDIKLTIEGRAVDLQVSTLPTQFGESLVLRVLDKSAVNLDLDNGLPENVKWDSRCRATANGILSSLDPLVPERPQLFTVHFGK